MSRLPTLLRLDLRLQVRYRFYHVAIVVTLVWLAFLRALPAWTLELAVPFVIFTDLAVVGFYFIAALVLYEKDEAILHAIIVTPLRFGEYLASKLATLTLLALALSLVVAVAGAGFVLNPLPLTVGIMLLSLLTSLAGFIAVAPFTSISGFLIPSGLVLAALGLPLIPFAGVWQHPLFYLMPTHGPLLLLGAAFRPIEPWQIAYALGYSGLWIALLTWASRRAFQRSLLRQTGGR